MGNEYPHKLEAQLTYNIQPSIGLTLYPANNYKHGYLECEYATLFRF